IICSDLEYIFAYFLKLTAFFSFCLFLGILVKRSAFAIGFLFVWNIIEGIIIGVMKWKIFKNSNTADHIAQFLPLESMSNLIKEPFTRLNVIKNIEESIGGVPNLKDYGVHWYSMLIVICWIVIFVLMSYKILQKRDL
ncbi:ABC transporter permease subunit, partial [uncultured Flavobacterium sp.]|uniref:ABC transporter permease subunit n=1 Tax=uncultured Flavobacterium sp. TaxID=165435 RepID=UPI002631E84F